MAVLVYLVEFTITGVVRESITPSGLVHSALTFTVTGAGLNSTVQFRVTLVPTGRIGLTGSLEITTIGVGTGIRRIYS